MIRTFRYYVPSLPDSFGGWGVFVLDSTGFFSASTDYGNYMYHWPQSFNGDFREFVAYNLCRSDDDYILRKVFREGLKGGKEYDAGTTRRNVKQHILYYRKGDFINTVDGRKRLNNYTKEEARELWDAMVTNDELDNEHNFDEWAREVSHIDCEAHDHKVMVWDAQAVAFRDELLLRLRPMILAELDRERLIVYENGRQRIEYREVVKA
jgi:hypothetical protein